MKQRRRWMRRRRRAVPSSRMDAVRGEGSVVSVPHLGLLFPGALLWQLLGRVRGLVPNRSGRFLA
jgi:hypothetical protein